jgi:hypothetical protein
MNAHKNFSEVFSGLSWHTVEGPDAARARARTVAHTEITERWAGEAFIARVEQMREAELNGLDPLAGH